MKKYSYVSIVIYILLLYSLLSINACQQNSQANEDSFRAELAQAGYGSPNWYKTIDQLIEKHPDNAWLPYRKAVPLFRRGDYIEGIASLSRAVAIDPTTYANYRGAVRMTDLGDYEGAIQDFQLAIDLKNHIDIIIPGSAYERKGIAQKQLGKYEEAIQTFDKTIKKFGINGVDIYTFMYRGIAKRELGQYEKALADFQIIIDKWEKCPEAYYHRGLVYIEQGKKEEACTAFKRALLYKNYIHGNPGGAYIDQLYEADIERMFDKACR